MKLLIDTPLVHVAYDEIGTTEQDRADSKETWDEACAVLNKFGVHYTLTYKAHCIVFLLKTQKITLDDLDMNELIYDGLWVLDMNFQYAGQAGLGRGCETSFTVTQRV
jgi:hypothetical protein